MKMKFFIIGLFTGIVAGLATIHYLSVFNARCTESGKPVGCIVLSEIYVTNVVPCFTNIFLTNSAICVSYANWSSNSSSDKEVKVIKTVRDLIDAGTNR